MGISIEQGVVAAVVLAIIGLVLRSIDKEVARKMNSETAEVRLAAIEASVARIDEERKSHADEDKAAFKRIDDHMEKMWSTMDALPDRIIARLKETKL